LGHIKMDCESERKHQIRGSQFLGVPIGLLNVES
jgi:hypothetical protein